MPQWQKIGVLCTAACLQTATAMAAEVEAEAGAFPWVEFLQALQDEFTGPIPLIMGTIATVTVAFMMYTGQAGDATKRFIGIIVGVSVALKLPTLIMDLTAGFLIGG